MQPAILDVSSVPLLTAAVPLVGSDAQGGRARNAIAVEREIGRQVQAAASDRARALGAQQQIIVDVHDGRLKLDVVLRGRESHLQLCDCLPRQQSHVVGQDVLARE